METKSKKINRIAELAREISTLQAQNEGYRAQNKSLQKENAALKGILDAYKIEFL